VTNAALAQIQKLLCFKIKTLVQMRGGRHNLDETMTPWAHWRDPEMLQSEPVSDQVMTFEV
jgi:hypothetical protein